MKIIDGNCFAEKDCEYELTNAFLTREEIAFAEKQLRLDPGRKWQIKIDEHGFYTLYTDFKPKLSKDNFKAL